MARLKPIDTIQINIDTKPVLIPVHEVKVLIIGSGSAGLNAAIHLVESGIHPRDILIITDDWGGGTSYNAGSDKQTYYKLSISGSGLDSPLLMAKDLHEGGSMHGDIALCEAACSIEEFFHLVRLGVHFPRNEFGVYVGYRTDNDLRQRATSVGPYTSKKMVTALASKVLELKIPVLNHHLAMALVVDRDGNKKVEGVFTFDLDKARELDHDGIEPSVSTLPLLSFKSNVLIMATGGPANIYASSVYPREHFCSHGLGIEIGAKCQNLSFMQYGISSKKFRWNLSGSYQQAIPSYIVKNNDDGTIEEILHDYLPDIRDLVYQTFLKGYQWPFNPKRCNFQEASHSSLIDLIVHSKIHDEQKRVFLDFRHDPWELLGVDFNLRNLPDDAFNYLNNSGAIRETPIERLKALNPFAIEVYEQNGIDLYNDLVEIQIAVQHCNGGFSTDHYWESINIPNLYFIGEICGTHGQHRPGGAALNSGQVGGLRAALRITSRHFSPINHSQFMRDATTTILPRLLDLSSCLKRTRAGVHMIQVPEAWQDIRARMDRHASIIREHEKLEESVLEAHQLFKKFSDFIEIHSWENLISWIRARDACLTHLLILSAMAFQIKHQPGVNPCYIKIGKKEKEIKSLAAVLEWLEIPEASKASSDNKILLSQYERGVLKNSFINARPIPESDDWFENLLKKIDDY
ncbi:MAG: FAD-binding protein [Promethearchaeota archaeon]